MFKLCLSFPGSNLWKIKLTVINMKLDRIKYLVSSSFACKFISLMVSSRKRAIHLQQSETFHEMRTSATSRTTSSANILNWVANLIRLMKDKNLFCYSHRSRQKFERVYWSAETCDTKKCNGGVPILQTPEKLPLWSLSSCSENM
jgi:type IV secretory pathway VirB3-like protein